MRTLPRSLGPQPKPAACWRRRLAPSLCHSVGRRKQRVLRPDEALTRGLLQSKPTKSGPSLADLVTPQLGQEIATYLAKKVAAAGLTGSVDEVDSDEETDASIEPTPQSKSRVLRQRPPHRLRIMLEADRSGSLKDWMTYHESSAVFPGTDKKYRLAMTERKKWCAA